MRLEVQLASPARVLVEADEQGQLGGDLVGQVQACAEVWGMVRAASAMTAARPSRRSWLHARVEVGDPAHRQAWRVGDLTVGVPERRTAAGRRWSRLVHDTRTGASRTWP